MPAATRCASATATICSTAKCADVFRRGYAWQLFVRLDEGAMRRAARALVGTHDFRSFQTSGSPRLSTVRTVYAVDVVRDAERSEV